MRVGEEVQEMSRRLTFTEDLPGWPALRGAVEQLTDSTERRWGTMTSAQMLRHTNGFCALYLGELEVSPFVRFVARLLGKRFLRRVAAKSPMETPRNMRTLPVLHQTEAPDFAAEQRVLLAHFDRWEALESSGGVWNHPMYGEMAVEDCAGLVRHHTAHHLNQFGVLSHPQS